MILIEDYINFIFVSVETIHEIKIFLMIYL